MDDIVNILYNVSGNGGSLTPPFTGYTSDLETFTFQTNLDNFAFERNNVLWDFGDGNIKSGLTVSHAWELPGVYDINVIVESRDKTYTSVTSTIHVSSYYNDQVTLTPASTSITASIPEQVDINYILPTHIVNNLSDPYTTINLYCSGSLSDPIDPDLYASSRYDHFKCLWYFTGDGLPTNTFNLDQNKVYVKLDDKTGVYTSCIASDEGAINVGVSGHQTVYFTDNYNTANDINIFASFDQSQYMSISDITTGRVSTKNNIGILQTKTYMTSLSVTPNTPSKLVFSTYGLSGFDIGVIKKQNTPIYYYINIADDNGNILKCPYRQLQSKCLSSYDNVVDTFYDVQQSVVNNTATSYYYTTAANINLPGAFPGAVVLGNSATNVQLSASVVIPVTGGPGTVDSDYITITGTSNLFDVISEDGGNYNIHKVGEDFNFYETIDSYIGQQNINSSIFFKEVFLRNIFGDNLSEPTSLGKLIYEKIENFAANHSDIDLCNIDSIYAYGKACGLDLENYQYSYPGSVKRLVNLLSINFKRLFGYNIDSIYEFNQEGYTLTEPSWDHGRNLGDKISPLEYTVEAGKPIVVEELFNKTFRYIYPTILSAGDPGSLSAYPLSAYDKDWGWGLTYPDGASFTQYYNFYEYRDNSYFTDESLRSYNSIIDWTNSLTTIDKNTNYQNWIKDDNGVIEILYILQLLKGFNIKNRIPGKNITFNTTYSACSSVVTTTTTTTPIPEQNFRRDPDLNTYVDDPNQNACD